MDRWSHRFFSQAREVSTYSKDPRRKVGAVIARGKYRLVDGFNGFPKGIADDHRLYNQELKRKIIIHAEKNALHAARENRVDIANTSLYVYGLPVCEICAPDMIQAGIKHIHVCYPRNLKREWVDMWHDFCKPLFHEVGIVTNEYFIEDVWKE